jgi:hypothetical protein
MKKEEKVNFTTFASHMGVNSLDACDARGRTMLHNAASTDDHFTVSLLLEAGADPALLDRYNFTAYGLAMRDEQFKSADVLLPCIEDVSLGAGTFSTLVHLAAAKLLPSHLPALVAKEPSNVNMRD